MIFNRILKKVVVIFFFSLYYTLIFNSFETEGAVRIVKRKLQSSPIQIHLPSGGSHNSYAKRYGYGRPVVNYNANGKFVKNKRYSERRNKKLGPRNYANAYKNWTPNRFSGGKYNQRFENGKYYPRIDNGRRGFSKPRKEPYPFLRDPPFKNNKQKRKIRPPSANHLQKPKPPKYISEFDDDYYFPEETLKAESQNGFESVYTRTKKKRRNPNDDEKFLTRPDLKIPYQDRKPGKHYSKKIRSSPYGTYVRQSHNDDDSEDYSDDKNPSDYMEHESKSKKKRTKKKSSSRKKHKDEEEYPPYAPAQEEVTEKSYSKNYDKSEKNTKKRNKKQSYDVKDENEKEYPQNFGSLSSVTGHNNNYWVSPKPQDTTPFVPSYSQSWSHIVGTTGRPVTYNNNNVNALHPQQFSSNGYNYPVPQGQYNYQNPSQLTYQTQQNQYNYQNRDYANIQKPHIITANSQQTNFYSQPENYNKNTIYSNSYVSNQAAPTPQAATNYNTYSSNAYSTYQQGTNSFGDNSILKRSPTYDSSQTQYAYNGNAYIKNQSLSYLDNSQNRISANYQNANLKKLQDENDFLQKHQSLYNKGLSGVPIQGDGYRKDNLKKDYDIGYGDFQFDETLST